MFYLIRNGLWLIVYSLGENIGFDGFLQIPNEDIQHLRYPTPKKLQAQYYLI
jgi:hypothetical protein